MAETYKKHTHREHILELPDTYIGSTEPSEEQRWVYDAETGKMTWRTVAFNQGLYKIFDEIIVNARDAFVRAQESGGARIPVKSIDVIVTETESGLLISVENDGDGIPIEEHPTEKVYIPELIFGHLLTSSNYNKAEEKIVGGKNGYGGKCCWRGTKVPLFNGKIKRADEICVGDEIIGDDGKVRNVLSIITGKGQLYKVNQAHAESYIVNDEHTLTLMMPDHKVIFWNTVKNGWSMLWWNHETNSISQKTIKVGKSESFMCEECGVEIASHINRHYRRVHKDIPIPTKLRKRPTKNPEMTEDVRKALVEMEEFSKTIDDNNVFDMEIKDYMALNKTTKLRIAGIRGKSVEWEKREVELDPYVLGLWLGDGFQTGYGIACYGEKDPEIIDYMTEWGKSNDATIKPAGRCRYSIKSTSTPGKKGQSPLRKYLAKYNLINNKHIPTEYLINDRDTRLKVLAGLIDTDGHVSRDGSRIVISQGEVHKELAEQIVYLARSLGFCVNVNLRDVTYTYKGEKLKSKAYQINISGEHLYEIPTRLPRKKCSKTVARATSTSTGMLDIEDAGIGEFVGIKIDGNERFLINDFTVTHNCTNIFSDRFTLETKHPASGKTYTQTWRKNMSICEKPTIKKSTGTKGYVRVEFEPDMERFHGTGPEIIPALHTRIIELAALVGSGVKVTWNGTHIATNTFEKFIRLFLREGMAGLAYENCGPRWEVGAVLSSHLYSEEEGLPEEKHISFVNGILTKKGGKHVETVARNVLKDFCDAAEKKKVAIKPAQLKDSVVFFVNATVVNPSFDSQTKEFLTTPANKFGSSPKFSGKLTDTLIKLGLLDEAKYLLEAKAMKDAKKTDGKKRTTLRGLPKLEDALWAGTAKSAECTLILTEGDSAATSAISGLNVVGREKWGVFPLRGKLLNVKDITIQKFNANEELTAIKRILGLEHGKTYKSLSELRYGRVMIMADQDHDGSHIKGLVMNLFHTEWPQLLEAGFLCTLKTPLMKASKGKEVVPFYAEAEYRAWLTARGGDTKGWSLKYYKGLGTSTPAEAREWFRDLHEIKYEWDVEADESINLAFNKKRADDRKKWLNHYDPDKTLEEKSGKAGFSSFIHNELIHFSNADNIRSLPNLMDGLKPSQRKILFSCFKRNLRSEIRVAQLSGYVSEHASYHHGEASLNSTIIGMAQNFVGSNNLNLLKPIGQFGSRLMGGKDSASPRYIHTELESIVDTIFRKEDNILLNYLVEDGEKIEPTYYLPVVPLLALNGAIGIGTGFSTDIPPHNPSDIITLLKHRLTGGIETLKGRPLDPWWFGFTGKVSRTNENTWITRGAYEIDETKHTVTITELPVGTWTKDYKAFLDDLITREGGNTFGFKSFDDLYNDIEVKFILYFTEEGWDAIEHNPAEFEKNFKLNTTWKTTNMCCFDAEFNIVKYDTIGDILEAFIAQRLPAYEVRRTKLLEALRRDVTELQAKRAFLQAILDGKLELMRKTDDQIVAGLKACGIPALSDPSAADSVDGYEYVLRLRIDRVKQSAIEDLDRQVAERVAAMESLEKQTPAGMWLDDLGDFESAWTKYVAERISSCTAPAMGGAGATSSAKRVVRRTKAAGGAGKN